MANNFSLNTAGIPGLNHVLVALPDGTLFDWKAQQSGGVIVVSDPLKKAVLKSVKVNGVAVVNEA